MIRFFIILVAMMFIAPGPAFADTPEPIPEGITEIDFDADGQNEILVKARHANRVMEIR